MTSRAITSRAVTIMDADQLAGAMIEQLAGLFSDAVIDGGKKWARRNYARRAPLVTRREGTCPL